MPRIKKCSVSRNSLFELFCPFSSEAEQSKIMSDLRHRVPPPQLLLKLPKEIAFLFSGENISRQGDFNPLEVRIDSPGLHLSTSLGLSNGTPYSSKSENNRYSGSSQHKTDLAHLKDDAKLGDMSLREWLARPERVVDQLECLHIFVQIVETVDLAHSKGLVLQNIRPSCLKISPVNLISFIDSTNSFTSPGSSSSDCCNGRISLHTNGHNNKCNMNEETQFVRIGQEMLQALQNQKILEVY